MKKYILKFKGWFIITNILVVINTTITVLLAFMFKYIIDLAGGSDLNKFYKGIFIFILYIAVDLLFEILQKVSKAVYVKKTMVHLKNDIFSHILSRDIKSFNEQNSAKYISILTNDINMIEQDGIVSIFNLVRYVVGFILAFISTMYISIPITVIILCVTMVGMCIPKFFGKMLADKKIKYSKELEELTTKTKDILSGFEVIKNFNIFSQAKNMYNKNNEQAEFCKQNFEISSGLVDSLAGFLGTCVFATPIFLGGYMVIKGKITIGTLIALIQLMNNLSGPLSQSIQIINKIKSLKNICSKIEDITKEEPKQIEKYSLDKFNESIEFKNVSFSYDNKKLALENINVKFESGKKYALVGGSGSGKSTILKIILRYYNGFKGNVFIDGMKHEDIRLDDIYKHLSVIQQNVFMFDGSIKDNIALFQEYSEEEIMGAVKLAGLGKLVDSLPNGINECVGENGCKFSGGEKQRIAIARALIKKSSLMLLDESTSALDNETAYSIEKSILNLKGVTSIVVTHKLMEDILKDYDEIIVMRNGRIVEIGDFYKLINEKGYFYNLYNVAKGFKNKAEMAS